MSSQQGGTHRAETRLHAVLSTIATVAVGVGIALVIRAFVFEVYSVPTGSMLETIQLGDHLVGEKITYRSSTPQVGDVVTFLSPEDGTTTLIKRVVAVGGQTVDLTDDGVLYVDGVAQEEPYTLGKPTYSLSDYTGSAGIAYPYIVPHGMVFVMGDNRTNSLDSRYFGPVSVDAVSSRAVFIFWPPSDARGL